MNATIQGACVVDNDLYFSMLDINGLCKMNLDSFDVSYVCRIPGEGLFAKHLYSDIKYLNDRLYLIPMGATEIAVYDPKADICEKIPFTKEGENRNEYHNKGAFVSATLIDNMICMMPYKYPSIVGIDEKLSITYYDEWICHIRKEMSDFFPFTRKDIAIHDHGVYGISSYYNAVIHLDLKSGRSSLVKKGPAGKKKGYFTISFIDDSFVLMKTSEKCIYRYDTCWNLLSKQDYGQIVNASGKLEYMCSVQHGRAVYFIPFDSDTILKYNTDTERIEPLYIDEKNSSLLYFGGWIYEDRLFCYKESIIDIFQLDGKHIGTYAINMDKSLYEAIYRELESESDGLIIENEIADLNSYIGYIS